MSAAPNGAGGWDLTDDEAAEVLAQMPDDPFPSEPGPYVENAATAAAGLSRVLGGYSPEDWRDAVRLLREVRRVKETIARADDTLSRWLYLHGEHGIHLRVDGIPGDVGITRGRSKERWAAPEAVRDYVEAQIVANDGEVPDPLQVVAWVLDVLPSGTSTSCKKTALRNAGLDVEDYLTSEPGSIRVDLPREDPT